LAGIGGTSRSIFPAVFAIVSSWSSVKAPAGPAAIAVICSHFNGVMCKLLNCFLPAEGWGRLVFQEVRSAAGREWTDDGEVHETRSPKGGPRNAVRRVPIPPTPSAT
jgi:hypothetical protein